MKITFAMLFLVIVTSCNEKGNDKLKTQSDKNKIIAQTYFEEVWNKGNVQMLDSLLDENYINHTPSIEGKHSRHELVNIVLAIRKAFPDLHFSIDEVIATPEYVTIRTTMSGTQSDALFNIPATGRSVKVHQINIEKIVNGRISEHWRVTDELTLMKQLGLFR